MKQSKLYKDQLIVITGAAGFIGSCLVRQLNDQGFYNLILVDDFKKKTKWKNLVGKKFVDIISKNEIFNWLEGRETEVEAFLHLGACSDTMEKNVDYMIENNYRFSVKLIEYALLNDIRFIYASSAATYGDGSTGFSDDVDIDLLNPLNIYGYSKQLFDQWIKRENVLSKVIGLKYFNVFGPNENHKKEMSSVVFKVVNKIIKGDTSINLFKSNDKKYKDGEQKRDFIYVKDAVRMTSILLKDSFKEVSGIFNIGTGNAITWNDLIKCIFETLDKPYNVKYIDIDPKINDCYQNYTCANISKFKKMYLDMEKQHLQLTPIKTAIQEYINDYILQGKRW